MSRRSAGFWHMPDRRHLQEAVLLAIVQTLWFLLIYGGADYLTSLHGYRIRVHFDAELTIPFIPAAVLVYNSLYPLSLLAPFVLPTRRELRALAATLAAITLVAGVCFLVLPVEPAFPPPGEMGVWTDSVRFTKWLARTNNYLPSLHVGLAAVCALAYARRTRWMGKALLTIWAGAIGISTMLLHQHYVVDVVAGYVLAAAGVRCVYVPWCCAASKPAATKTSGQPVQRSKDTGLMLPMRRPRVKQ